MTKKSPGVNPGYTSISSIPKEGNGVKYKFHDGVIGRASGSYLSKPCHECGEKMLSANATLCGKLICHDCKKKMERKPMVESKWSQELMWVARNEHGTIVRISQTDPQTWVKT